MFFICVFFVVCVDFSFSYFYGQSGKTPLHIACENAHKDIISLLLSYNANLKAMDLVSH